MLFYSLMPNTTESAIMAKIVSLDLYSLAMLDSLKKTEIRIEALWLEKHQIILSAKNMSFCFEVGERSGIGQQTVTRRNA